MKPFRGQIEQEGRVVFPSVIGWLAEPAGTGASPPWDGYFGLEFGKQVGRGGVYRLVLDDGRSGDIVIGTVGVTSTAPPVVHFRGSGPLR
jgi:hypothetical protein